MKFLIVSIFILSSNLANAQSKNFDSLCNACKSDRNRRNFCEFKIDTTANKYSSSEISKEISFFKLLDTLLLEKRVSSTFKELIKKTRRKYFVFMRMDFKFVSANLTAYQYIFQSENSYGDIIFLVENKNIILSGLRVENKKKMICISKNDTLNFPVTDIDYDYYRTNIFPVLGKFSNRDYQCGYFYTDNYLKLDEILNTKNSEKVRRFDKQKRLGSKKYGT